MIDLISYTLEIVLELLAGSYFRYSVGVLVIIGVLALFYILAGKSK